MHSALLDRTHLKQGCTVEPALLKQSRISENNIKSTLVLTYAVKSPAAAVLVFIQHHLYTELTNLKNPSIFKLIFFYILCKIKSINVYKCYLRSCNVFKCLKGSYDAISSFPFSWSVTSCLCIDKIPEVAKTKVSKPKRYSLEKLRLCHAPLKRLI